jgi:hypothetical protein
MNLFQKARQFSAIIIAGIFLFSLSCKGNKTDSATLIYLVGEVRIFSKDQSGRKALLRDRIQASEIIETGLNSHAALQLGKQAIVRLGSNTRIQAQSLFLSGNKTLFLEKGTLLSRVSHLKKGSAFEIKTATAVAAVRGTAFSVSMVEGSARIAVSSGKVKVDKIDIATGQVLASTELEQGKSVLADKDKTAEIKTANISALEELEIRKVSIISFLDNPQSVNLKELDSMGNQIQSRERPIIRQIEKELEQTEPKGNGKALNLESIKKKYKRIDEITLYNGRVILGAIISRGEKFEILTPLGTVKVSKNEVKSTRIIQ